MKTKLLALLLFMLVNETSSAQYSPMLTDNPKWTIFYSGWKGETGTYTITQGEDVVVGPHTYKKFIDPFFGNMEFLLREDIDNKKVYKIVDGNEVLFLDFNLQLGDQFAIGGLVDYTVSAINDISVNGGLRRQLRLHQSSGSWPDEIWIEGVGNRTYPFWNFYEMFSDPIYFMKCSFKNDVNVFNLGLYNNDIATDCQALGVNGYNDASSKISFTPNPFQTDLMISSELSFNNTTLKMYNAMGQIVKQIDHLSGNKIALTRDHLTSGLYLIQLFENGKLVTSEKILVKD
jgi:hypothetical protein